MMIQTTRATCRRVWDAMKRSHRVDSDAMQTPLNRCLTAFDLTLLGIGNMAGAGIYVLTGTVVRDKAGPSTFLSYLVAGITAFLNALCYAELGSRIPKAGSAYTYTYVASGEFLAFVVGWSMILEYVLSVSSVARGWSGTLDAMTHHAISNGTMNAIGRFPVNAEFLGEYPDFLGALLIIALGLILCRGPKLSAMLNTVVTLLNLTVIILATIIMLAKPQQVGSEFAPANQGGFFPFGFGGMIGGAGTCFYAFIGFDAITVSSEEALNPKRSMPIATAVSVTVVTLLFLLASLGLTLFVPWWTVDRQAAFTAAFHVRNVEWATYVTGIGSLLGLSASLFTSMYAMPRIGYAMAADGLLPKWIGYVMPSTQVPIVALWLFGVFAAILTFLCDIHLLADFLSIGTLIAYTIVAVNVCILRYTQPMLYSSGWNELDKPDGAEILEGDNSEIHETNEAQLNEWPHAIGRLKSAFRHLPILRDSPAGRAPIIALLLFIICAAALASLVLPGARVLEEGHWWAVLLLIMFIVGAVFFVGVMFLHEQNKAFDSFKVPFVPFIPCLCIFLNFCLIVKLSPMTWIRFIVWLLIGLMIYFAYGWRHSIHATDSGEKGRLIPTNDVPTEPTMVDSGGVVSRPKETNNVTYE
ncbi:Cationic amino acid transporter 4 [Clonorchis sinensis]|uniref:Cationic amino acid transporter 4 n=1 Tax=Clonorchis sinensis TaxID=79923 RepID=A0A8T1MRP0_CLOSI|nr:Cationic amino acid transporter 4 [Clonorchis sinensis]